MTLKPDIFRKKERKKKNASSLCYQLYLVFDGKLIQLKFRKSMQNVVSGQTQKYYQGCKKRT